MRLSKKIKITGIVIIILIIVFLLGPKPSAPTLSTQLHPLKSTVETIQQQIVQQEKELPVKQGNNSQFFWADSSKNVQTDYCLLYLHGFSASPFEGSPTDINFARHFGMNAYIPLLACHGIKSKEPLIHFTGDTIWESAKKALQVAHLMGKKVIIMSTSTGGTLSLLLAQKYPQMVDALILLSPNIAIKNPAAPILAWPWGLKIARLIFGGKYHTSSDDPKHISSHYWYNKYRLEATVQLQELLNVSMRPSIFKQVKQPVFLGYYYKDEKHNDPTVSVPALLKMYDELGTSKTAKEKQAFDAGVHVIGCGAFSKAQKQVQNACIQFAEQKLKISAKNK